MNFLELSKKVGNNLEFIQAGGGNTSYKEGNKLFIKASGCELGNITEKNFISVDIQSVLTMIDRLDDNIKSLSKEGVPSIETPLHALMKYKYVFHLHHLDTIVQSLYEDWKEIFTKKLSSKYKLAFVEYFRPGLPLALEVKKSLECQKDSNVIIMKNHGIVLGADSLDNLDYMIEDVSSLLHIDDYPYREDCICKKIPNEWQFNDCHWKKLVDFHNIWCCSDLLNIVVKSPFYPDHVVYLGSEIIKVESTDRILSTIIRDRDTKIVIVPGYGIFVNFTKRSEFVMLETAVKVCRKINPNKMTSSLSKENINDLQNWDAEKFRQRMSN